MAIALSNGVVNALVRITFGKDETRLCMSYPVALILACKKIFWFFSCFSHTANMVPKKDLIGNASFVNLPALEKKVGLGYVEIAVHFIRQV